MRIKFFQLLSVSIQKCASIPRFFLPPNDYLLPFKKVFISFLSAYVTFAILESRSDHDQTKATDPLSRGRAWGNNRELLWKNTHAQWRRHGLYPKQFADDEPIVQRRRSLIDAVPKQAFHQHAPAGRAAENSTTNPSPKRQHSGVDKHTSSRELPGADTRRPPHHDASDELAAAGQGSIFGGQQKQRGERKGRNVRRVPHSNIFPNQWIRVKPFSSKE